MTSKVAETAENKGYKSSLVLQCVGYYRKSVRAEEWEREQENVRHWTAINDEVIRLGGSISFYMTDPPRLCQAIERPGLMTAITMLEADLADVLIVPALADLAWTTVDLVQVIKSLTVLGKRLVILEEGIDTGTKAGRLLALAATGCDSSERAGLQLMAKAGRI